MRSCTMRSARSSSDRVDAGIAAGADLQRERLAGLRIDRLRAPQVRLRSARPAAGIRRPTAACRCASRAGAATSPASARAAALPPAPARPARRGRTRAAAAPSVGSARVIDGSGLCPTAASCARSCARGLRLRRAAFAALPGVRPAAARRPRRPGCCRALSSCRHTVWSASLGLRPKWIAAARIAGGKSACTARQHAVVDQPVARQRHRAQLRSSPGSSRRSAGRRPRRAPASARPAAGRRRRRCRASACVPARSARRHGRPRPRGGAGRTPPRAAAGSPAPAASLNIASGTPLPAAVRSELAGRVGWACRSSRPSLTDRGDAGERQPAPAHPSPQVSALIARPHQPR